MVKTGFFPDYSDANPYQQELAEDLERKGHRVEFFDEKCSISKRAREENLDVVHFHWLAPYIHGRDLPKTLFKTFSTAVKLLILKSHNCKTVWTVHNIESHDRENHRIEKIFKQLCTKLLFDKIITHCSSAKKEVKQNYRATENQVKVIEHGNYIDSYPNKIEKAEAREKLGLETDRTVFLCFGQIRIYKGIPELVEQFKKIESEKAALIIAGSDRDTELTSEIKKKASEDSRIEVHDCFVPKEEVQIYMNASDCIVLPYRKITTSGTLVLAMSFDKPVLAPSKGCIPEYVNKKDSILFESTHKLTEAIQGYLKGEIKEEGGGNLAKIREINWDEIAEKTGKLYIDLLKSN